MDLIHWLQATASPAADTFWGTISVLYAELIPLLALTFIYWCVDARFGWLLGNLIVASTALAEILKAATNRPRPDPADVRVIYAETAVSSSFPSNHVLSATVLWGAVAWRARRRWLWPVAAVMILLVALSRLYLGLHWPADVAGGALIGAAFLGLAVAAWSGPLRARLSASALARGLFVLVPVVLFLAAPIGQMPLAMGVAVGINLGYLWLLPRSGGAFPVRADVRWQVVKLALGWGGMLLLRAALKAAFPDTATFEFARYAVLGLWASWAAPLAFRALIANGGRESTQRREGHQA